ncbi:hypothetical protein Nepgr_026723 [Nepenthes gracilis]|uniref:NAC domain-containing protein n=1 Tax=Nepenthes gracilis TaxID=150966 RepID=A0AAD3T8G7_NEPGR|nr:hypothetical protein Nepgr_026723 [Nepenthes gracilis]
MRRSLSMVEASLPPGFRFHPRDDELISDYLMKKVQSSQPSLLIEVDLNKCEPWDIPETACVGGKKWYFYSQRDRKYATGFRTNRATVSGYWKATGKDRPIMNKDKIIGMRKTLVFHQGRAPKGKKTEWVMHEFRLEGPLIGPPNIMEDWVLCRVFYKNSEGSVGSSSSNNCCDDQTVSSLMDYSCMAFDQTPFNNISSTYREQVPCFSNIFSTDQASLPPPFSESFITM